MKFVEFEDIKKLDIGYIFIPERIILDDCGLVNTEVLLYTYLAMNQTMRKRILFSGYDFCKWLNVSYSKRDGEILDRVEKSFKRLLELNAVKCFSLHEKFGRTSVFTSPQSSSIILSGIKIYPISSFLISSNSTNFI